MSLIMRCPSCGCRMPAPIRCHSCRQPRTQLASLPEHLFAPPNDDRRAMQRFGAAGVHKGIVQSDGIA